MKKILALLLALAMIFSLAACTSSNEPAPAEPSGGDEPSGEPHYKEEIVIAMADEFTTIDPMETSAETNQIIQDCTHDLLTDTNLDTMQNDVELLESWEMIDPTHWSFKLKPGIKFHDGTILNSDDVYFTWMVRGPQKSLTAKNCSEIKNFEIVDDLNFNIELAYADVDFNYVLASNTLAILSKEAFETMPEEEAVKIGTGPWMFEEFVSGDYVSLVRFEDCTLYPVPHTKRLVFKMIPEAADRMIALENDEVDVIMTPNATDYNRLIEDPNLQLITETGRGQHFIGFNLQNPNSIVTNPKFRLAVAKGINKEDMVTAAWDGYAQVSTNIHCRGVGYYHDIEGIPYDPEGAQALFDEIGATGMTIPLVTSDAAHRQKMATEFQSQMAKYGITITIETMQNSALTELNTSDGHTNGVELLIASWTPGMNADYMYRNTFCSDGSRNYVHLADPEIDEMIKAAATEVDTEKRDQLYLDLQNYLTCEVIPWVPIAQATMTFGARAGVTGARIHPALVHQFKAVERIIED